MADARLTPQDLSDVGITPTRTALSDANTYQVLNDGNVTLHFMKSGANEATITITTVKTERGLAIADRTLTVPASTGDKSIGPFDPKLYNNSDGDLEFVTSESTAITCAVFRGRG